MFSLAMQPPPPPPPLPPPLPPPPLPPPQNFVSAITFEGFKLRSSNLTNALLVQISRTISIIDIVKPSKMAAGGHFVKNVAYRSEMARIAIESEFRTSKMAAGSHFVKNVQTKLKLHIDLKWPEMRSKVKFGHPKWPTSAILSKNSKKN